MYRRMKYLLWWRKMSLIDGFLEVPPMLLQEEHYLMNKCKTVEILVVAHLKAAYAETFEMQYDLTNQFS